MYEIDLDKIDLTGHPPDKEPERQYYFMAKCREYVQRLNEKWGHPPTYTTVTFGCQMNSKDSEKLSGILEIAGFIPSESEEATLIL